MEVILTKLRIGRSLVTHGHFIEQDPVPYYDNCIVPPLIEHVIAEYSEGRFTVFFENNINFLVEGIHPFHRIRKITSTI